jgi:hypothetical protein
MVRLCNAPPLDQGGTSVLSASPWINGSTTEQNEIFIAKYQDYNVDPETKYTNLTNTQQEIKVAMSLHLHHVPQAAMLECKLEILILVLYSK